MCFKSEKELNYDRFVDPNILGAARLVHSDLRIYRISLFLHGKAVGYVRITNLHKIHLWRQSIVKTVDSDVQIYRIFYTGQGGHNMRV